MRFAFLFFFFRMSWEEKITKLIDEHLELKEAYESLQAECDSKAILIEELKTEVQEVRILKVMLEDKNEALELLEEQQEIYIEDAEEAVLNLESVSGDYDKVHSEFTQLKVDYENVKSEHVRQTGIIIKYRACAEIKSNLLQDALKKMKVTQNDRSLTRNLVTEILHANGKTEEERKERRAKIKILKRMMVNVKGYSSQDCSSIKRWKK